MRDDQRGAGKECRPAFRFRIRVPSANNHEVVTSYPYCLEDFWVGGERRMGLLTEILGGQSLDLWASVEKKIEENRGRWRRIKGMLRRCQGH